jgi:hypothetical protein
LLFWLRIGFILGRIVVVNCEIFDKIYWFWFVGVGEFNKNIFDEK